MKKLITAAVLCGAMVVGAGVYAKTSVSAKKHPNLAAAQVLIAKAAVKITAAQKANEYDLDGHAAKAKDLLDQADAELKLAAQTANDNNTK